MLGSATKLKTARDLSLTGAVNGKASFDGSGNVSIITTQANIAVLSFGLSITSGNGSTTVNYPQGYTKDNCFILSFEVKANETDGYTEGYFPMSAGYSAGALGHKVSLRSNDISVSICNPLSTTSGDKDFNIKIVLMKI